MCEQGMSVILLRSLIGFYGFIVVFSALMLYFRKILRDFILFPVFSFIFGLFISRV